MIMMIQKMALLSINQNVNKQQNYTADIFTGDNSVVVGWGWGEGGLEGGGARGREMSMCVQKRVRDRELGNAN